MSDEQNAALSVDTFPYQFQRSVEQGCFEVYFRGLHLGRFDATGNWIPSSPNELPKEPQQ